ncbi:MAG: Uma2 family endonuclease [Phycisphaeraceae bacterium]
MPERIRWRLIQGELFMMSPAGGQHGRICSNLSYLLKKYSKEANTGESFGAETGYILRRNPDTMLAPDASFITADRADLITEKFIDGPPDLAIEVISPSQSVPNATEKAELWLELGARVVWLVWPKQRLVTAYTAGQTPVDYGPNQVISGIAFMPGFACPVDEVFA